MVYLENWVVYHTTKIHKAGNMANWIESLTLWMKPVPKRINLSGSFVFWYHLSFMSISQPRSSGWSSPVAGLPRPHGTSLVAPDWWWGAAWTPTKWYPSFEARLAMQNHQACHNGLAVHLFWVTLAKHLMSIWPSAILYSYGPIASSEWDIMTPVTKILLE